MDLAMLLSRTKNCQERRLPGGEKGGFGGWGSAAFAEQGGQQSRKFPEEMCHIASRKKVGKFIREVINFLDVSVISIAQPYNLCMGLAMGAFQVWFLHRQALRLLPPFPAP